MGNYLIKKYTEGKESMKFSEFVNMINGLW